MGDDLSVLDSPTVADPVPTRVRNSAELPAGFRGTTSGATSKPISTYTALLSRVRDAGLLERRTGFYIGMFVVVTLLLAAAVAGSFLLGDSWFQLLIAGGIGLLFTQYAFLAHETAHRQVFSSGVVSDRVGRILASGVVGMSYAWWTSKHTKHHGNPNTIGRDTDIDYDTVSFLEQDAVKQRGLSRLFTQKQGYAFFPILLFEGVNLHLLSYRTLFGRGKVDKRWHEIAMVTVRFTVYLGLIFWFLPVGMAFAFVGVQLAIFGLYMGSAFAPNHIGMPIIPEGSRVDFLSKQVLTSRNITGGGFMTFAMGGLDYQVEHHLFPSMARPHLRKASKMVREHCLEHGVPYTQNSLPQAFGTVIRYLNRVGLAARRPFDCPMAAELRPR
ncbi:fatty acid desaturase [Frondihabitans sp. PhB188]|uniref:fatty acid desaturase family protein n=1 Tax=Frondihabitans sp. PhB188 TaxID=2485200 RepID=UPI000F49C989|nr:acyl-CoA desaturase [Frondihabitans sp. PhB188]ROQ40071.1 fatty acid desaturase [Frondihabitans sp. PhB188]